MGVLSLSLLLFKEKKMSWTITPTISKTQAIKHEVFGDRVVVVKLACISDANAGSITMKSTRSDKTNSYRHIMDMIEGSTLYLMEVIPGTGDDAPSAAFDIDVENERNVHILDTDSNSETSNTFVSGSTTLSLYPPIFSDITVVIGSLGNGNTADIYLYFWK